jgi:hypothetical protein
MVLAVPKVPKAIADNGKTKGDAEEITTSRFPELRLMDGATRFSV